MHRFVLVLIMTLSASLPIISACALAEKAQEDKKNCNEQASPKSVGIGIFGIGIGQIGGKSDVGKASKECRSAKAVKTEKTAQQKK